MKIVDFLWEIFSLGYAPKIVTVCVCAVSYVFFITLFVCFFCVEWRLASKKFFLTVADFGYLICIGSFFLDFLSAKSERVFNWIAVLIGIGLLFIVEYLILLLQMTIGRKMEKKREGKKALQSRRVTAPNEERKSWQTVAQQSAQGVPYDYKRQTNPVKRVKYGGIKEVALRKIERRVMGKVEDNGITPAYLNDCIQRLKRLNLSEEDGKTLLSAESNLAYLLGRENIDKKKVSDYCGKIITLLAKYC